jgi:hypothetical protein
MNEENREKITLISLWYSVQVLISEFMPALGSRSAGGSAFRPEAGSFSNCSSAASAEAYSSASRGPLPARFAEQEDQPRAFARLERDVFHQRAAVVAAELRTGGALAALHRERVSLRAVRADERIPQAVVAVRLEIRGEKLPAVLFVIQSCSITPSA